MRPILIENAVINFGAPKNWKPENGVCGGLPVRVVKINGQEYYESAWEPSPEDLELLNKGGSIHLFVSAYPHPVVALNVNALIEDEMPKIKG